MDFNWAWYLLQGKHLYMLCCLAALKTDFGKLPSDIVADEANWKAWNDSEAPEAREFPAACSSLNLFQRMCVVKCFRADRSVHRLCDTTMLMFLSVIVDVLCFHKKIKEVTINRYFQQQGTELHSAVCY